MSDDDNDLGGLSPTTPLVPRTKKHATSIKPNTRAEAGPSSKPAKGRKNALPPVSDHSDIEELASPVHPFDFSKGNDEEPFARQVRSGRGDTALVANGNPNVKGKGKAKVPQKSVSRKPLAEPVDSIEVLDDEEHQRRPQPSTKPNSRLKQTAIGRGEAEEISRLREQLRRAQDRITTLTAQLEEVHSTRETEVERLYNAQQAQFDVQLKVHEDIITELNTQLAMKEPLMRSGNSTVLNLLTREAADEEKRAIEQEVQRWKSANEQKQRDLRQRDEHIATLEQTGASLYAYYSNHSAKLSFSEEDLRAELKEEIKRSGILATKANRVPPSATRGARQPGIEDPKHAEIIRFYEDVTNLIIPAMKAAPGEHQHLGLEEWSLTCIYTTDEDANDNVPPKKPWSNPLSSGHNFNLRLFHEVSAGQGDDPVTSKDQLIPTVHYTPQNLEKEDPEYVEKLEFLKDPFTFPRSQLPLFLRTIFKTMNEALKGESDDEGDSVQEIEMTD
ncbi:hypothetical protein C0991_010436 [Blastosporella zonata]|nr:hypothetical protein C0991_010436 [Blastosporella zonata]